ncbi:hypothetical protein NPIL_617651 [Nephila pilipes]|uniref:Uncharacterized protein n=1 Tax=Nephila pilipes TaxID=299642 RepID=A0A8X6UI78_NEPPI|nr:hypothetical protein NPIL_617651 [Nephila pilipes]
MGWSDVSRTCRPVGRKEVPSQLCEVSKMRSEAPSVSRGVYPWSRLCRTHREHWALAGLSAGMENTALVHPINRLLAGLEE